MKCAYWVKEVSTDFIHLVSEYDTRNSVFSCLTPNCFSLRFNTWLWVKNGYSTVQNAEWTLYFDREVHVSWCVDDVYTSIFPLSCCSRRSDSDPTFLLLLHPVHLWRTFVSFTDFVNLTSVVKDTLSCSCLTSIDVSHDTDITSFFKWKFACHEVLFSYIFYFYTIITWFNKNG